ncbi:inovirus Gp2 family protein [Advenella sp. RU8]|uniref:inovirus Gp2 family protein n=1 Tax=Advenella sp. RU8 TaxID=3399575 RepID=UPI003AAE5811
MTSNQYFLNSLYQSRINTTLSNSLLIHPRTMVVRVDLRLPEENTENENVEQESSEKENTTTSLSPMTRFFESLKSKIHYDLLKKEKNWQKKLSCQLRYVWVREFGPINRKKHFHVLIFLNKDVYHSLGDFSLEAGNLSALIRQAWCSALNLPFPAYQQLVHFPKNGTIYIDVNKLDYQYQLYRFWVRANYLAKEATKQYGDGERSFGCSVK